jgi:hypothetical protein
MALTEKIKVDQIEVTEMGFIQVRTVTIIEKDGLEISRSYHRHTKSPGDDVSNEDIRVQNIASAVWTQDVIDAYQDFLSQNI